MTVLGKSGHCSRCILLVRWAKSTSRIPISLRQGLWKSSSMRSRNNSMNSIGRCHRLNIALFALCCMLVIQPIFCFAGLKKTHTTIRIRVLTIDPSPGSWTGTDKTFQRFEGMITASSSPLFTVGSKLQVAVPLAENSRLFDRHRIEFDKSKIAEGKLISLDVSGDCVNRLDEHSIEIDTSCVIIGRR